MLTVYNYYTIQEKEHDSGGHNTGLLNASLIALSASIACFFVCVCLGVLRMNKLHQRVLERHTKPRRLQRRRQRNRRRLLLAAEGGGV